MLEKGCFPDSDILIFLSQLIASFGIREEFNSREAKNLFFRGDLIGVIREVKQFLRLPCGLKITLVKSGFRTFIERAPYIDSETKFRFNLLSRLGMSIAAIVAHPQPMPQFGTPAFMNASFPIVINAEYIRRATFETFVANTAHEMAHLILESVYHPLRKLETAVDLAVMVLGFNEIARRGTFVSNLELGYLTYHQLDLAYKEIRRLRKSAHN